VVVDGVDKPVATIETTEEEDGTTQTTITTNEDLLQQFKNQQPKAQPFL
jgi:hypothetical protein